MESEGFNLLQRMCLLNLSAGQESVKGTGHLIVRFVQSVKLVTKASHTNNVKSLKCKRHENITWNHFKVVAMFSLYFPAPLNTIRFCLKSFAVCMGFLPGWLHHYGSKRRKNIQREKIYL